MSGPPARAIDLDSSGIAAAAQLACLLEAHAPKPGNVSPGRPFSDVRYEDFLASAAAIGGPFASARTRPLGATVRLTVESTLQWTSSNTNLGIVLLLTPLVYAAMRTTSGDEMDVVMTDAADGGSGGAGESTTDRLRAALRHVLDATTVDDAREVYAAIRLAAPGGLGRADSEDVADEPSMTLLDVMRLAAERDGIAREYATGYDVTFTSGVPALERARHDGLPWDAAIVETFLTLLAHEPDTHIARRGGEAMAASVSARAREVLAAGGVRSAEGRRVIDEFDRTLRDPRHLGNPGTTADLVAAALFVVIIGGGWSRG